MAQRLELQALLETMVTNVYFQPPPTIQMAYPCIIYKRDDVDIQHADNKPYKNAKRYQVTVIDQDPDSPIPGLVQELPSCQFDRFFTADNLNHDVHNLYF